MILLADTNVFIKYWRALAKSQKDETAEKELEVYKQIMSVHEVVTCGVVRAELLHGATSEKNYQQMRTDPVMYGFCICCGFCKATTEKICRKDSCISY